MQVAGPASDGKRVWRRLRMRPPEEGGPTRAAHVLGIAALALLAATASAPAASWAAGALLYFAIAYGLIPGFPPIGATLPSFLLAASLQFVFARAAATLSEGRSLERET